MAKTDGPKRILVAGAGYAGLHVAQRSEAWLRKIPRVKMTLVDRHDYHQLIIELPRVATGTRRESAVQVGLEGVLSDRVHFVRTTISGFDFPRQRLVTEAGEMPYDYLALGLGSRPNDFGIPGLAERVHSPYTAAEARAVWDEVNTSVRAAAASTDVLEQERLMTVVIGGGGATGVELAGAFAEELPELARRYKAPAGLARVILVEAGHSILAGSSPELIAKALGILTELKVEVYTNTAVAEAFPHGFRTKHGRVIEGGVFIWAGGVKAPELVRGCGLTIGYNGRIKVDEFLRAIDHPEIFVAGDLASVVDPNTGHALPVLAQVAVDEGDAVAHNLRASIEGLPLTPFVYRDKGFVITVGGRQGVADVAGFTIGGRLAHALKDAIEWEYRQSIKHLRGFAAV